VPIDCRGRHVFPRFDYSRDIKEPKGHQPLRTALPSRVVFCRTRWHLVNVCCSSPVPGPLEFPQNLSLASRDAVIPTRNVQIFSIATDNQPTGQGRVLSLTKEKQPSRQVRAHRYPSCAACVLPTEVTFEIDTSVSPRCPPKVKGHREVCN